ncbi:PPE domain-containing protein [Mycolicibacter longobardus]|uniref:PPE domain-containing protein n=1 Tax=Mycolicibacter longobardus TaxID=1108812 RepID=UPI000A164512|nr:PPE domain-containing protein [Mycolicibacter longobardus]MCV7382742.1 PPE domain-containing protein [Mycolicibacter longobardus]
MLNHEAAPAGRRHTRPGSTPMTAASAAWRALAAELMSTAHSYETVMSGPGIAG